MYLTGPIASSTLLPKIHRNSMFPPRWRIDPCMHIDVKTVSHFGSEATATVSGGSEGPQTIPAAGGPNNACWTTSPQCVPECVSEYGIAPYLTTSAVSGPEISEPPCLIDRM